MEATVYIYSRMHCASWGIIVCRMDFKTEPLIMFIPWSLWPITPLKPFTEPQTHLAIHLNVRLIRLFTEKSKHTCTVITHYTRHTRVDMCNFIAILMKLRLPSLTHHFNPLWLWNAGVLSKITCAAFFLVWINRGDVEKGHHYGIIKQSLCEKAFWLYLLA